MIVTLLIALYIASVLYLRNWIKIAHSKDGRFSTLDVEFMDFFYTFVPIFNTLCSFVFFFISPYENKQYRKPINYNKIFGVKK